MRVGGGKEKRTTAVSFTNESPFTSITAPILPLMPFPFLVSLAEATSVLKK